MSFAGFDDRSQQHDSLVLEILTDQLQNLIITVAHHFLPGIIGMGLTDASGKEALRNHKPP